MTALLGSNPFPQKPPVYVRAVVYDYRYSSPEEKKPQARGGRGSRKESIIPPQLLAPRSAEFFVKFANARLPSSVSGPLSEGPATSNPVVLLSQTIFWTVRSAHFHRNVLSRHSEIRNREETAKFSRCGSEPACLLVPRERRIRLDKHGFPAKRTSLRPSNSLIIRARRSTTFPQWFPAPPALTPLYMSHPYESLQVPRRLTVSVPASAGGAASINRK